MANQKQKPEKSLSLKQPKTRRQTMPTITGDLFGQPFLPSWWGGAYNDQELWAPAINVSEKEDRFIAKVELPGVHEEDVNVVVVGDMLIVEGEKEAESEVKEKGYSYSETSYGSFSRSLAIPSIVDVEHISANFDKGVLEIDLPKSVEVKPKKVNVTTKKKTKTAAKKEPTSDNSKK